MITGPSGVGKGTLISSCSNTYRTSSSPSPPPPGAREGEVDGRDYHFLAPEEFDRRIEAEDFSSSPPAATATAPCAQRLLGDSERATRYVLEIEVQGARQVRAAMREPVQVFIAPPDPASLRRRLEKRGTDSVEAIDSRLEVAEHELPAQGEFAHSVVNDDLDRAAEDLEAIVRAELGISLDSGPNDQTTR